MSDISKLIKLLDIEDILSKNERELLSNSSTIKSLQKGQILQRDHNECVGVPVVLNGELRLFSLSESGREMNIYRVKQGEICLLAALCILTQKPYEFMVCAEKETKVMMISATMFRELVNDSERFNQYILSLLADKLIYSLSLYEKVHLTSINEKLLDFLYDNADEHNIIRLTHSTIAKDLGSSRVVISRAIAKLREQKIIETGRSFIKII